MLGDCGGHRGLRLGRLSDGEAPGRGGRHRSPGRGSSPKEGPGPAPGRHRGSQGDPFPQTCHAKPNPALTSALLGHPHNV
ncbi:hypothetical protein AAFF_G00396470 [Aldrovandia affinis]|uniref:Uncharacterized protein n=1 Tax=Aldrovandia affinis TaxID=143900 RepID=A0AAD7SDK8_9TELE|nr:hypothetical protein AAFF_G00396470 [Aldrovandia affinis]